MKLIFVLSFLLMSFVVQAQSKFGVRGGVSFSNLKYYEDNKHELNYDPIIAPELGLFLSFRLGDKIFLEPEVNFLEKGGSVPNNSRKTVFRQVECAFPLAFNYNFGIISIFFKSGPFYSHVLNGYRDSLSGRRTLEIIDSDNYNLSDFGFLVGGGTSLTFKLGKLFLEGRYRQSFFYNQDFTLFDGTRTFTKNFGWAINLGFSRNICN